MAVQINHQFNVNVSKDKNKQKILVVSHERSGTHFLINTLINCFDYHLNSLDIDHGVGINFYNPPDVRTLFMNWKDYPITNILKSHHHADFFKENLRDILPYYRVLYIYRDPRDALVSFWKLIKHLEWHEGPKCETIGEFIRATPEGGMMRYQPRQYQSIAERWAANVGSWTQDLPNDIRSQIVFINYEQLNLDFEGQVKVIAQKTGLPLLQIKRPNPNERIIPPLGPGNVGTYKQHMKDDDLAFIQDVAGELMVKLGYQ